MGMTKSDKIRTRIANGDGNLRFEQVHAYLVGIGATFKQTGSHVVYRLPSSGRPVTIVKPHGNRKTVHPRYITNLDEQLGETE